MPTDFSFLPSFVEVTPNLITSGQPNPDDFARLAAAGVETVINLAAPSSESYIVDEAKRVLDAGMRYVHIPVPWDSPQREDFEAFRAALSAHEGRTTLVHCALNMRVSAFVYLARSRYSGEDEPTARARMQQIWTPNETWQRLIDSI